MRPPIVSLSLYSGGRTQGFGMGTGWISWDKEIQTVKREEREREREKVFDLN